VGHDGRKGRAGALVAAGVVVLGVAAFATSPADLALLATPCTASTPDEEVGLSRDHARSVTTLAAAALRDGVPAGAVPGPLAAVLADVDAPALDPAAAAGLLAAPPPVEPDARAAAVTAVVLGDVQGALTCRTSPPERVDDPEGPGGLTPRAERLRAELEAAFGSQSLGGFAPGGVRTGHVEGSAHYEGRALDVFFRPVTPEGTARGWAVAHWAVAHAAELDVATVIFDRQVWSARRSADGWRPYRHPSGDDENPVLAHEDHVHVDVGR
jgi:hypothetical protein